MSKLTKIQNELKAPKNQFNSFGNYKYRNCEDILEAIKPILLKYDCFLTISDDVVMVGDRYYIKATATLVDCADKLPIASVTGFAREAAEKKNFDTAQLTGAASSYARKYALNGLFAIDDSKDADYYDNSTPKNEPQKTQPASKQENKPYMPSPFFEPAGVGLIDLVIAYWNSGKVEFQNVIASMRNGAKLQDLDYDTLNNIVAELRKVNMQG